jgi:putative flippase GtrA
MRQTIDSDHDDECRPASRVRALIMRTPRTIRFLAVGALGLAIDIVVFTAVLWAGVHPLVAQPVALAIATLVTWRLNRLITFDASGRSQGEEAVRYGLVTVVSQGASYLVFAVLVVSVFVPLPQAAIVAGAAVGALISYNGHRLFAFAPRKPDAYPARLIGRFS